MKIILSAKKDEFWSEVVADLTKKKIDIAYWIGEIADDKKPPEKCLFHEVVDEYELKNLLEVAPMMFNIERLTLEEYYSYLKILDRADDLGGFSFNMRDRLLKDQLNYWYSVISAIEPTAIVFSNIPHLLSDYPLYLVAQTGKPMIISTGMANLEEIAEAVSAAKDAGCSELALLHCVSGYPAPAEDYNLRTMVDMQQRFGIPVGLSDHTLNNTTAITAVALGVCIIEKHFTLDRTRGGPDDSFSLEPSELQALGKVDYGLKSSEQGNAQFRRSLYFVKDMKAGGIIDETCIRSVRPGYGLAPKYYDEVMGRKVNHTLSLGIAVT